MHSPDDMYEHAMLYGIQRGLQEQMARSGRRIGFSCRTARTGFRGSCGGWPNVPQTSGSSSRTCCKLSAIGVRRTHETDHRARRPRPSAIALTYRVAGDDHWLQSRVSNLSESGVLFGPTDLRPGVRLELIIASPIAVRARAPGRLVCTARVVRTTEAGATAAFIEACRFVVES